VPRVEQRATRPDTAPPVSPDSTEPGSGAASAAAEADDADAAEAEADEADEADDAAVAGSVHAIDVADLAAYTEQPEEHTPARPDERRAASPAQRRRRGARRRPPAPRPTARRTCGNILIACAGADFRAVGERDRSRFASAGALMLLTAGLAAYAGASIAAFGFGISTLAALPYGVFYALFIFFIDRSVLLTVRPLRAVRSGGEQVIRPRRGLPTAGIRIFIAVCGALLIGESLLLRFFDSSIEPRVAELRQQELAGVLSQWDSGQQASERRLTAGLAARKEELTGAEDLVTTKTGEVNCQLTGGSGCVGGRGPVYQIKLGELRQATAQIPGLRADRDAAQARVDAFQTSRDQRRARYADAEWNQIRGSNDLLIREKGFWRLTRDDTTVKLWRIVLSLLILGIDLAPLLFKRSLDRTAYARADRAALWDGETSELVDAHQLARNADARRGRADDVADRMADRYERYAVAREEIRLARALDEDTAAAVLRRDELWLGHDHQAADLRRAHRVSVPSPTPPDRTAGPAQMDPGALPPELDARSSEPAYPRSDLGVPWPDAEPRRSGLDRPGPAVPPSPPLPTTPTTHESPRPR
jgi:hypothetical protein